MHLLLLNLLKKYFPNMDNTARIELIKQRLSDSMSVSEIDVEDDSHKHVGHAGAKSGKGHFNLFLVSDDFDGKSLIQRHRMVYEALGDAMETEIHALSIKAHTTSEKN